MENSNAASIESLRIARPYWFGECSKDANDFSRFKGDCKSSGRRDDGNSDRSMIRIVYRLILVCYPSPFYRKMIRLRPVSSGEDVGMPQRYRLDTINVRSCHWRFQFMPFNVVPEQNCSNEFGRQEFHYFVVIDFEATCDKFKQPNPQEIIEFPSVLVNSLTGQMEDCFQTYVRPTHHPVLTDFCKELTGIQQTQIMAWIASCRAFNGVMGSTSSFIRISIVSRKFFLNITFCMQVDSGVLLSTAIYMHDKWLQERGIKRTNFTIVTWTDCDCLTMLEPECKFKGIFKPPYFNRWINLKVAFHEVFGRVHCNLKEAVKLAGLNWEGRAHCGLDDARNTARLLVQLMRRGISFSITSSIECPQTSSSSQLNSQSNFEK